jgi:iron complex transport system permease protein
MGINIKKSRYIIIIATGILSGACTAFVGPVAFVGLAVPHISRMLFKTSNHFILFFANCFLGALVLLICDSLCQLPGEAFLLPINAVTSMAGAPVVIWLLINRKSIRV